jgi:hypothetical protein
VSTDSRAQVSVLGSGLGLRRRFHTRPGLRLPRWLVFPLDLSRDCSPAPIPAQACPSARRNAPIWVVTRVRRPEIFSSLISLVFSRFRSSSPVQVGICRAASMSQCKFSIRFRLPPVFVSAWMSRYRCFGPVAA